MFGKLMSVPDHLIADYFELLTDVSDEELEQVHEVVAGRTGHPGVHMRNLKVRLASTIVSRFHSEADAEKAAEEFERVFSKREVPDDVIEFALDLTEPSAKMRGYNLARIIAEAGLAPSSSEASRLIRQGAVERQSQGTSEKVLTLFTEIRPGEIFRVGKHRFLRIVHEPGKFLAT
jgi:tyrosyl-tRNA synthetase